jgi:hypothetical protein
MRFTKQHWAGLLVGVGLGLGIGAALVEIGWLSSDHKAWVSVSGIALFLVGGFFVRKSANPPEA